MKKIKINIIGANNNFNVYINQNKLKKNGESEFSLFEYNEELVNKEIKLKIVQNHVCDCDNWFLKGIIEFIIGIISGIGGYSDSEENRGSYRAYCEGDITIDKNSINLNKDYIIDINLEKSKAKSVPLKYNFKFNVKPRENNIKWNEIINVFESPKYLRRRWNIIRMPYYALGVATISIIILAIFFRQ